MISTLHAKRERRFWQIWRRTRSKLLHRSCSGDVHLVKGMTLQRCSDFTSCPSPTKDFPIFLICAWLVRAVLETSCLSLAFIVHVQFLYIYAPKQHFPPQCPQNKLLYQKGTAKYRYPLEYDRKSFYRSIPPFQTAELFYQGGRLWLLHFVVKGKFITSRRVLASESKSSTTETYFG